MRLKKGLEKFEIKIAVKPFVGTSFNSAMVKSGRISGHIRRTYHPQLFE